MAIDTGSDISIIRQDVLSTELQEQIEPVHGWLRTATERENQSVVSVSCSKELDVVSYLKPYGLLEYMTNAYLALILSNPIIVRFT